MSSIRLRRIAGVMLFSLLSAGLSAATVSEGLRQIENGNGKAAQETLETLAHQDDTEAMYQLGVLLFEGKAGIRKQRLTAISWWEKAAYLDHVPSQLALGTVFYEGLGVRNEPRQGYVWNHKAAMLGSPEGMKRMGDCHFDGTPCAVDPLEAAKWYRRAALKGHSGAEMALGRMLSAQKPAEGLRRDAAGAWLLMKDASETREGHPADRNAASEARILMGTLTGEEMARAHQATVKQVLDELAGLENHKLEE